VETLEQLHEALDAGATMILLDNMGLNAIATEAVRINAGRAKRWEVSGGVNLFDVLRDCFDRRGPYFHRCFDEKRQRVDFFNALRQRLAVTQH